MNPTKQIMIISEGEGLIRIGPRSGDYIDFRVERQSLSANARVYLYDDNRSLLRLFEDISANWQGWEGNKSWSSLEGDVNIVCSTDRLGHVSFSVEIANNNVDPSWMVRTKLVIDAGGLEGILQQAKAVLA